MVSDFQRVHCTDFHSVEIAPDQFGKAGPGAVLADFDGNYYPVYLDHYEGDEAYIKVNDKVYKVEPRLEICHEIPLSYAWTETRIFVEPAEKTRKEILDAPDSTEEERREVIDWCMDHLSEADEALLHQVADLLYFPKHKILDLEGAKRCFLELAQRPGCPPGEIWRFYGRAARISYLALEPEEGDLYAEKAMEPQVYGGDIQPLIWKIDYEWHKAGHENYSELYRYGKLPVIKALVDARKWQAMAYLLDRILPLEDEGMRCIAELCETCLMETFRESREENFSAIAPVAFYKCLEHDDFEAFKTSWPYRQLQRGVNRGENRAMYYHAYIEELVGRCMEEETEEAAADIAKSHIDTAIRYYRRCVDCCDRQAMVGLVCLLLEKDPENEELPFLIRCLRAFSYKDQIYTFLGDEDPDTPIDDTDALIDDTPDDDGRFDAWA